ncbi:MAG: glycosyl transferase [Phycisphaerales bacterium]|nr:glycosyl transferase [Phycisphaerales bacterium]
MNKICMYTPSADGGMAQYAWELLNALAAHPRGGGGDCFELVSGRDLQEQFKSDKYPVHAILPPLRHRSEFSSRLGWIASRLGHYPYREWAFLRWLRKRPDIGGVHFQERTPWLATSMFRRVRAMGKKVFYTVHNVLPHNYPAGVPRATVDGWTRKSCLLCDGLFVHTEALAAQLSQFLGEPHPPIQVVPHGVWTVRDTSGVPSVAERLTWKRLLFFGAIRRNKGLDLLLRAMEQLPGYRLTIAGEPLERQYFQDEVLPQINRLRAAGVEIDLQDHFTPDGEVAGLFARHGAVVLPYTQEFVAQSGVIFMALAHEIPVVASEAGGMRDLFGQYKVGETFKESSAAGLADAIRALHGAATDSVRLIEEIRLAKRRFSWGAAASATIAGYALAHEGRKEAAGDCPAETNPAL